MAIYNLTAAQLKGEGILNSFEIPAVGSFTNLYSTQYAGVDDYIDCGTGLGDSEGVITKFSVSMWIKPDITTKSPAFRGLNFFNLGNFSNSFGEIFIGIKQDVLTIRLKNGSRFYSVPYTNTTNWEHIAFVYDGSNSSNTKLYINNVVQSPTVGGAYPSSLNDATGLKTIIGAGYSVVNTYQGLLDEVSYFDITLSSANISTIYNSGTPNNLNDLSTPPLSWWRFEEGSGTTAIDSGTGGNNGTLTNGTAYSTDVPS